MNLKRALYLILCLGLLTGLLALPAMAAGINIDVQTNYEVVLGETLDLHCTATSNTGAELSYIWYETATGKLDDMYAINRGTETYSTFRCDTTQLGTRYYLCSVSDGAAAVYSDIITVRVVSENGELPVVFTADSEPVVGGSMTVDIKKMINYDADLYNAFLEGKVSYEWYRDGQKVKNATGTMKFTDADAGCFYYVLVKGNDVTVKSEEFPIEKLIVVPEIETTTLPEATVGERYSAQLQCYDDVDAKFIIYYNPGKANDFEKTGLALSQDGKLTGKPAKAGEFTFTVCAANDGGEDYATYTLTVKDPATDPTETTEGITAPTQTTTPSAATDPSAPAEDVAVIAPADPTETVDETGGDSALAPVIAVVIVLAVLAAAAAAVVIIILILRKNRQ